MRFWWTEWDGPMIVAFQLDITGMISGKSGVRLGSVEMSVSITRRILTCISVVIQTIRTTSISKTLFALFELFQEAKVSWNCEGSIDGGHSGSSMVSVSSLKMPHRAWIETHSLPC